MKKYKQILAGLLAMNLAVYVMPTGMVQISASAQNHNEKLTDTESAETNPQDAQEAGAGEDTQEEEPADSGQESSSDAGKVEDTAADFSADNTDTSENADDTELNVPEKNTENNISSDSEETVTAEEGMDDLFSDGSEPEPAKEAGNTAVQASGDTSAVGTVHVSQFKDKTTDADGKVTGVTVKNAEELILLSNCDPSELQNITIHVNTTGTSDLTGKITKGEDISGFYSGAAEESQQLDAENTEDATENNSTPSEISEEDATGNNSTPSEVSVEDTAGNNDETQSEVPEEDTAKIRETEKSDDTEVQEMAASEDSAQISGSSENEAEALQEDVNNSEETRENLQNETSEQDAVAAASVKAEKEYTFQGIGSPECPFQGEIQGTSVTFQINRAFFGGVSSKAKINMGGSATEGKLFLSWVGDGTVPMLADMYQFDSKLDNGHVLNVKISAGKKSEEKAVMGTLIGDVQAGKGFSDEILNIDGTVVDYKDAEKIEAVSSTGNAGLICNTLKSGNICLNGYQTPTNGYTAKSESNYEETNKPAAGNAGGFIGVMGENTKLSIQSQVTVPEGTTISSQNGNAGGMVGLMQKGAKIITGDDASVEINAPSVVGKKAAGGVAGMAEDTLFEDSDLKSKITVTYSDRTNTDAKERKSINGKYAGGFIGRYGLNSSNSGENTTLKTPEQIVLNKPTLTAQSSGAAGGYFGLLELSGTLTYKVGKEETTAKTEVAPIYQSCADGTDAVGAIAGQVTSNNIASTLLIQNMDISADNESGRNVQYHGGLIGEAGNQAGTGAVYLKVKDVTVKVKNPYAKDEDEKGFGGVAGCLEQGSILQTENTVKITTDGNINRGGGLVGYARKSVLNLSGTTDLSGSSYDRESGKYAKTGWLTGGQDCALIYANGDGNGNGWKYIRGKENGATKQAMNDIGNYGQIIRLHSSNANSTEASKLSQNLITIDKDHTVKYVPYNNVVINENTIKIGSVDAFALLSIAWNSRGYFGGISGITSDNFSKTSPKSKNITLSSDIDLTGSGIAGLSRDISTAEDTYTGIFDGNQHTIKLAAGETFGYKQDNINNLAETGKDGYGEVIAAGADSQDPKYHGRQGLFAQISGATIQNLTVKGDINISNAGQDILAGGIAGELTGSNSVSIFKGVNAEEKITADCANNQLLMVGGFLGGSYNSTSKLQLGEFSNSDTLNRAAATIKIENCNSGNSSQDSKINAGGVIGEIGESDFKFTANCLTVGGSITTDAKKRAYVGGLIGVIKGRDFDQNEKKQEIALDIKHRIEIKGVIFEGFRINATEASEVCGGLFGSIWANVGLYFMGESDGNDGSTIKLNVKDAMINAPQAASIGGLAYRSSGNWEIRDHGINLEKLIINAGKNVGLLVCRGERSNDTMAGGTRNIGALYLSTTKYWDTSYQIPSENGVIIETNQNGVFDEFVAYTTPSAEEIVENDKNGVISIATQDNGNGGRVGVDVSACTTYQNRTEYGKTHQTNACSRYYYDLDQCLTDMVTGGTANSYNSSRYIDTPQELMLWSVRYYACKNIKEFFEKTNGQTVPDVTTKQQGRPWFIGAENVSKNVELNMQKYSYYPIKYTDSSINVWFANIKFCNMEIEQCEQNQKSTQGTSKNHTQHYTMHCGLLLNYQPTPGNLNVTRVTFSGSIGKVNNSTSGALIANIANGSPTSPRVTTITINSLTFDNLKVNNCGDGYAPLLINSITHNVTLNANNITTKINGKDTYTGGTAVASSLIGTTGTKKAKRLNMTFQNIVLPDKKAEGSTGIFSHATLLESFSYDENDNTSGASYNFYKADDWSDTTHKHEVTYGQEITETTEYPNFQKWYYDEDTYGNAAGLVYDNSTDKSFSATAYLKYVCEGYNKEEWKHEIRVNQRVTNIIHGCGTYGHPYQITTEKEMEILSEYMATGTARKDWRVTITRDQSAYHQTAAADKCDATYQFDGNYWELVENKGTNGKDDWKVVDGATKLTNDFMLQYLLNAYYDIQGAVPSDSDKSSVQGHQLNLTDFGGFGSVSNPFRGVLTSSTGATIVLSGEQTGNGLIPYSYGSVIKNLKISYQKSGKTLTYNTKTDEKYYPKQTKCFGGVIGCVLGGDNIIEGVSVSMEDGWLTLSGEKSHLIQVGGYVGTVSGGGVIFRNMTDGTGLTDSKITNDTNINPETETTYSDLYINPYVGRVMDGFVFYEKTSSDSTVVPKINNTDKNYKINTLDTSDTDCIKISGDDVNVDNAQGLLILSAIINSGAASGGNSVSYSNVSNEKNKTEAVGSDKKTYTYNFAGAYGKVRNASYEEIGKETEEGEVKLSKTDDQTVPGADSLPYLIKKYCKTENDTEKAFNISVNSDVEISLSSKGTFDMSGYGNGYQGIGARYVSNAVRCDALGNKILTYKPEGIVPELNKFNGNNSTVILNMQVREYVDDDFHAASVGGMFNILRIQKDGIISNLTIGQSSNTPEDVSLKYYNANGEESNVSGWDNYKENVGVGGFAGSVTGYTDKYEGDGAARDFTFNNIQLNNLKITSSANAGGIIGNSGRVSPNNRKDQKSYIPTDIAVLLQPKNGQYTYGIAFNNCNYTDLTVTGKYTSGGFAGCIANAGTNPRSSVNAYGLVGKVTNEILGKSSTISATDKSSSAGGLFGYVETRMFINMTDEGSKITDNKAVLNDVKVSAGNSAGGCIGYINEKCYGIHNVTVKATTAEASQIYVTEKPEGTLYAGGIIGYAKGAKQTWTENWTYAGGISESSIENVKINDVDKANGNYSDWYVGIKTNYIAGGIVGQTAGGETRIEKCTVKDSKIYGSVAGGINGQTDSEMQFLNCKVKGSSTNTKTKMNGFSTAGGILGFWTGGQAVTIQNCELQYLDIEGKDWGVGAMIGDAAEKGAGTLYLFNCSAQDSEVKAVGNDNEAGGRWPCVGGIIGNLRNTIKASNLLFSNVKCSSNRGRIDQAKSGLLFGNANSNTINIAGISIQKVPETNRSWSLIGQGSDSNKTYIAFADYSGTAASDNSHTEESTNLLGAGNRSEGAIKTDVASPYVVTSPKSTLALYENENDKDLKYLYGDGAAWTSSTDSDSGSTSFSVKAQEIWNNKDSVKDGHYAYSNITASNNTNKVSTDFDINSVISTYNKNQNTKVNNADDFPVVQISAGKADTVKDYLNILTNGGFSAANALNRSGDVHVIAKTEVYKNVNGRFVKDSSQNPALKVTKNANDQITFSTTTGYDNDQDRFTLLTVIFTEKDASGKEHYYNVFVPVLVRRMLEIDFSATLAYGTDFKKEDYDGRTSHVLESYGSSITGYLSYIYNSASGEYTDYGWQSYIDAGGDMMDMKKNIRFSTTAAKFPKGTQLTLVDTDSGKAYYYTATGEENKTGNGNDAGFDIPLSSFADSDGKKYQEPSISELLHAKATKTPGGLFVKVDKDGKPENPKNNKTYPAAAVRIKNSAGEYEYYRLADSTLDETGEYSIKVTESTFSDNKKSSIKENYYLVVTVPKSDATVSAALNGWIQTTITSNIPHQVHYRKISGVTGNDGMDNHENTASTYQLSEGYQQMLAETGNDGSTKQITMSDSKVKVDVTDTITFPNGQAYQGAADKLFLRIVGGLQTTTTNSNGTQNSAAAQFPSGTTGEASFYVYTENNGTKTFYTYNASNGWKQADMQGTDEPEAVSYTWVSDGGNMELPFSTDGKAENAISLDGLRDLIKKGSGSASESIFYVQVKMDATIPGTGLDVIPESAVESGSPKDYVKLTYSSQLSTELKSLNYSSNRASAPKITTAYYREEPSGAKLTYDADKIDQLGINLLDLQSAYLDAEKEHSFINTTATYDLSSMKNLKNTLENSSGIRFTLSFRPKKTGTEERANSSGTETTWREEYKNAITNASDYLSVELQSQNSDTGNSKADYNNGTGTWSWTVPQSAYYDSTTKKIKTTSVFNADKSILTQAILLKVNVKNARARIYSNYMVELNAEILNNSGQVVANTQLSDNIIYTFAKIKLEFVE